MEKKKKLIIMYIKGIIKVACAALILAFLTAEHLALQPKYSSKSVCVFCVEKDIK